MKEQHKLGKKWKSKLIELKMESGEEGRKGSRERKRVTTEIIATFGKEKARGRGSKEARRKKKEEAKKQIRLKLLKTERARIEKRDKRKREGLRQAERRQRN